MRLLLTALLILLLCNISAKAQLKAEFTTDKEGGCSPLLISFNNTTTGASSNATYQWNFGNGNTSYLKNPGALFKDEKIYTVSLTVKDGTQTSTATKTITVYKKPIINFEVSPVAGCLPVQATFKSTSQPGDGTIAGYFWDYGDGFTLSTTSGQSNHTYNSVQKANVSLTVTNSYGCYATEIKRDLLDIKPSLKVEFNADKRFLCRETDTVKFLNNSTGPGTLSYLWSFGDGKTSTLKEPAHVFNTRGNYTVTLTVASSEGCTAVSSKTDFLNVANFKSDFTVPALICQKTTSNFINNSAPAPSSSAWYVNNIQSFFSVNSFSHSFGTPGHHTIKLVNNFGTCIDSVVKQIEVKEAPKLEGFNIDITGECGPPVLVKFKDTTPGAIRWEWDFNTFYYNTPNITSIAQAPSFNYTSDGRFYVFLRVTNSNNCTASVVKPVDIIRPYVGISFNTSNSNRNSSCGPLTVTLKANSVEDIREYKWNFGDGNTSVASEPVHTYSGVGSYMVTLNYTTAKGCMGTAYYNSFRIFNKPSAEFTSVSGTTICGNSFVTFQRVPNTNMQDDYWMINGYYYSGDYYNKFQYQFRDTGKHTITHIMYNDGCRDTVTKVDYITILPPFPKISEAKNTCDGNRGVVTFKQTSRYAEKWIWDFGDGNSRTLHTDEPTIQHEYLKTGKYRVFLTTSNGQCTLKDSIDVYVMLKQKPILTGAKSTICLDEPLNYTLTGYEQNPYPHVWVYHYVHSYQYGDGTSVQTGGYYGNNNWISSFPYNNSFNVQKGKDQVRVVTQQAYFNCLDTSNFIPIKVIGAVAGFGVVSDKVCYKNPVVLKDNSNPYNTQISNWEWNFGDGNTKTFSQGGTVSHMYNNPGSYNITLKIKDTSGCSSTVSSAGANVLVFGPKAAFTASGTNVPLNTTVYFSNSTNNFGVSTTNYTWDFGNGITSTLFNPSYTYTQPGTYTVKLIAKDPATGCTSEAITTIVVNNFNSGFRFTTHYLSATSCPPVVASFTNTSVNYTRIIWDFGDGFGADNIQNPKHVYEKPGKYIVTLNVFGPNGLKSQHIDSVFVNQPSAIFKTDVVKACSAQSIKFHAASDNTTKYLWDFGDGTIASGTENITTHHYSKAGIYHPKLLVTDSNGCSVAINMENYIVIDSLDASLKNVPQTICTPKEITFQPDIITTDPNANLKYHWNFGSGNPADTSNLKNGSFIFSNTGTYTISLRVESASGCVKEIKQSITAFQGVGAMINGPSEICQGSSALFTGATLLPGQPQWQWLFPGNSLFHDKNPPPKKFDTAGSYLVQLVVNNNGCYDTVTKSLVVHPTPVNILSLREAIVCKGSSMAVTASGGTSYSWSPAIDVNSTSGNVIIVTPLEDRIYKVTATNEHGCISADSIRIKVIQPFKLIVTPEVSVCAGSSITLKASGAAEYKWINHTASLNNTSIQNPVATPGATTEYTVVGIDQYKCFTDTATIRAVVKKVPLIDAGPNAEVLAGTSLGLRPVGSNDIISWNWSPAKYLSCTTCQFPEAKPVEPVVYTITVKNSSGCEASDTVAINLLCGEGRIYIPNTFTPNNDGKNDKFVIHAQGVKMIKSFQIFNRWGEVIFKRQNLPLNDANAAWDGKYKGLIVPQGSYVYLAEFLCNDNLYTQKGTITVVY